MLIATVKVSQNLGHALPGTSPDCKDEFIDE